MNQRELIEKLDYSPSTGLFTWKNGRKAGCKRKDGYIVIRVNDVLCYAHRLAWMYVYGVEPSNLIDHINGDKGDNRIFNLRDVDNKTNLENITRMIKESNLSGYRGVQKNHAGWQAVIVHNRKRICLGTYKTPEDAYAVYLAKKRELHRGFML